MPKKLVLPAAICERANPPFNLTLLSRILSQTFRSLPYSRRPSGRDHRDRTCDTPLPCCQDSPLSASPGLWCSDASSAKNEEGNRTGYDWHNPLRHA